MFLGAEGVEKVNEEGIGPKDLKSRVKILKEVTNRAAEKKRIDLKLRKPP